MISQTQTASNQYGFYAVPKKLQPKKKYRESEYEDFYDAGNEQQNEFQTIERQPVPEHHIERDFYVDEAPYPEFKPRERGLDYGVQIERGDLFDFDLEIQPLLEILVGRSVVSAINELQEEKQKVEKKTKVEVYQKKRNAELMVTQRLQAKSKRKREESERRVLQKEVFVKNQKEVGKKIIARKTAKKNLLGLRNEVISELQEAGYLRSEPYTDLRINFQGWLYDQITSLIAEDKKVTSQVEKMVKEVENQKQDQHKKKIEKQKKRRQDILDERQRVQKLNEQRKQKKRIRKQRIELNTQREPNAIRFDELLQKYTEMDSILRFENRSNGFSVSGGNQVHVSGGLMNFVIVMLNAQQRSNYSPQEMEEILTKLINESHAGLEIEFSQDHFNLIQEQVQFMNENPNQFMKTKLERMVTLMDKVSLNLRLLELANIHIKEELHDSLLQALLNIVLTSTNIVPKPEQEGDDSSSYVPQQKDRQRQELKKKLQLSVFNSSILQKPETILRVRFQRKQPSESQKKSTQNIETDWVDIYDGQGWVNHCKDNPQQLSRDGQKPAAVALQGFQKAFVYDERVLHFLRKELHRLLEIQAGEEVNRYTETLSNIGAVLKVDVPVYDGELRTGE